MKIKLSSILFSLVLVGAVIAIALLAPQMTQARRTLEIELAATPTPTADVRSMYMITPDPNMTPEPTVFLMKLGVKGDEVRRLQERLRDLGYYSG